MEKIRRKPEAHIKSLEMDPDRRILVVEGLEDRLLLEYICGKNKSKDSIILEISSVDIDISVEDGNRGRVIHFASLCNSKSDRISFFIDRDYQFVRNATLPSNVILTDYRDVEAYLLEETNIEKFIKIGLNTDKIGASSFYDEISKARYFGFLRITSIERELKLAVNKTNERLSKYIDISKEYDISILEDNYLTVIIQNTTERKYEKEELKKWMLEITEKYKDIDKRYIIHGKDLLSFISEVCNKIISSKGNIDKVFWMSFDKDNINQYPNLMSVVNFIS